MSTTELRDTVKQESKPKDEKKTSTERRKALLKLASQPDEIERGAAVPPYKSTFIEHPEPEPSVWADPKSKERRRRLRALTQETFPDGKIPDPYKSI